MHNEEYITLKANARTEYVEGVQDWIDKRFEAINPYNINTLKAELWYAGFQKAMHMDLYNE